MSRPWKEVRKQGTPEAETRIAAWVEQEAQKLPLAELRKAREMTQVRMAELLELDQGSISKLERRTDMYIRTLRSYIEAMGGQLHLVASFADGEVVIDRLGQDEREHELVEA